MSIEWPKTTRAIMFGDGAAGHAVQVWATDDPQMMVVVTIHGRTGERAGKVDKKLVRVHEGAHALEALASDDIVDERLQP